MQKGSGSRTRIHLTVVLLDMHRHLMPNLFQGFIACIHSLEINAKDLTLKRARFWLIIRLVTLFGNPIETCGLDMSLDRLTRQKQIPEYANY